MSALEASLEQVILLFAIVGVGVLSKRLGILDDGGVDDIGKLVLNVTFPALILSSLVGYEGSLTASFYLLPLFPMGLLLVSLLIGFGVSRLLRVTANARLFAVAVTVANTAFIGIPVNRAIGGPFGAALAVMVDFPTSLILWAVCVPLLLGGGERRPGPALETSRPKPVWLNPNLIALVIGVAMLSLNLRPPRLVLDFLDLLARVTAPLAMMMIGVVIAGRRPTQTFGTPIFWLIALLKLVAAPALAFLITALFGLHGPARTTVVLQAAMPTLASLVLIARSYGLDDAFAASAVFLTTLLALVTLPFWVFVVTR